MRILIVEDESSLASAIAQAFGEAGYVVDVALNCEEAKQALELTPDLIILDVMLPDGNGLDLLSDIRTKSEVPVIFLTARDGLEDRVKGLDEGADDYLVKPFRLEELLARVRAISRRRSGSNSVHVGNLSIDLTRRRVMLDGRLVFLSTTEFSLLDLLARKQGETVSKTAILKHVWDDGERSPNVVEVYINYLRHKLERSGSPRIIHTVRGQGYVLSEDPPE